MAVTAADVQATRRWERDPFGRRDLDRGQSVHQYPALLGFGLASSALLFGWLSRDEHYFTAANGMGYAFGIMSVVCIMVLLLFPLRKRFRLFKFLGPLPKWFRNHMVFGVTAPIAALYHCNFQLGSLNSRIALFSALLVAGSGLVGRFIYSKIHLGLYGRKTNLKELLARVKTGAPFDGKLGVFVPELMKRTTQFDQRVLVPPKGFIDSIRLPPILAVKTRFQYFRLVVYTRQSLIFEEKRSPVVAKHRAQFERATLKYVATHLRHVRNVAGFNAYDRLFALWRKVHLPFFVMLLVSVVVHVLAVYLY